MHARVQLLQHLIRLLPILLLVISANPRAFGAEFVWINTAGGNWTTAANWSPNTVPGVADTAIITNAGTYTVTMSSPASVSNLIVGAKGTAGSPTFSLTSTLTLGNLAVFETNATFSLGGTVNTPGSVIEVRGSWVWGGGAISGAGRIVITNTGSLYLPGNSEKVVVTNTLDNYGTINAADGFPILKFSGGAMVTNRPSGVINIASYYGFDYYLTPPQRSYLVNYGRINCAGAGNQPGSISIEFINYGTLSGGYCYISRGTNYGTLDFQYGAAELSFFGNETTGDYFSFEPGTAFTGSAGTLTVGSLVQWNAPNTVHNGTLRVGQSLGGSGSAFANFIARQNYTNSYAVTLVRGAFTVPTNRTANLATFSDTLLNGFYVYTIDNQGTLTVGNLTHNTRNFSNSGLYIVRTNFTLQSGGSLYGGGRIVVNTNATISFSGGSVDAQTIQNFGTVTPTASIPFTGNTYFENEASGQLTFNVGSFGTGPATLANFGSISGNGGLGFVATNFNSILADTPSSTLAFSTVIQQAGTTDIQRGLLSGNFQILGGVLTGTNTITGNVYNAATVSPGKPYGQLTITGNYTNTAAGVQLMPIGATNLYPQIKINGTASLAGTVKVTFTNGFFPTTGNTFTSLVFTASSGVFTTVATPSYEFIKTYNPTNFLLQASNSLPFVNFSTTSGIYTQNCCQPFGLIATASDLDGSITNLNISWNGFSLANTNSGALSSTLEYDFPTNLTLTIQALDNRGAATAITQAVQIVTAPLHVLSLGGVRTNDFKLCMLGQTGSNYVVFATTNLTIPFSNWVSLGTMESTNGIWRYFDHETITNLPRRFYRAKQLP